MPADDKLSHCRYYRGEEENPYGDLRAWFWDMERVYVQHKDGFHGELEYFRDHGAKEVSGIPTELLDVMITSWGKSAYDVRGELPVFYRWMEAYLNGPTDEPVPRTAHDERCLHFDRPDGDTWALARIDHKVLKAIERSPLWEREELPDVPLTQEQMMSLAKGCDPKYGSVYAPFLLGGWIYITRSGDWLKKFRYQRRRDGRYHLEEGFTMPKARGEDLLTFVLYQDFFSPGILNEEMEELFHDLWFKDYRFYRPGAEAPEGGAELWFWEAERDWRWLCTHGCHGLLMDCETDYLCHGLEDFHADDKVPRRLKAYLWYRLYYPKESWLRPYDGDPAHYRHPTDRRFDFFRNCGIMMSLAFRVYYERDYLGLERSEALEAFNTPAESIADYASKYRRFVDLGYGEDAYIWLALSDFYEESMALGFEMDMGAALERINPKALEDATALAETLATMTDVQALGNAILSQWRMHARGGYDTERLWEAGAAFFYAFDRLLALAGG